MLCETNGCAVVSADNLSFAWIFVIPARRSHDISWSMGSADDTGEKAGPPADARARAAGSLLFPVSLEPKYTAAGAVEVSHYSRRTARARRESRQGKIMVARK
eukprot:6767848-Pyramimonas_sp.AAC.1